MCVSGSFKAVHSDCLSQSCHTARVSRRQTRPPCCRLYKHGGAGKHMQLIEERAMGVAGVSSLAFEGTRKADLLVGSQEASLHLLDMAPEGQVQSVSSAQHSTVSLRTLGGQVCLTGPRRHLLSCLLLMPLRTLGRQLCLSGLGRHLLHVACEEQNACTR